MRLLALIVVVLPLAVGSVAAKEHFELHSAANQTLAYAPPDQASAGLGSLEMLS
jgi:hypothetical protein